MKTKTIPGTWLHRDGRRFDAGPYTSGALEAKIRLEELPARKDRLADLTSGYNGGIFNGPQFSRRWVDSPDHGVPFLGSSSMLMADLAGLPLLRRRDAESAKLSYLRIRPGTTLISCSGTIGRMVYVRPDMDGMWTSQHIMKVIPDPERIPPGYLYAFLSGKFGVPLVTSGTYGAIIQHIEPQHISNIPVPRLDSAIERQAHELVQKAAMLRSDASQLLRKAVLDLEEGAGLRMIELPPTSSSSSVRASRLLAEGRFDALFHSAYHSGAVVALKGGRSPAVEVGALAESIVEPNRMKRIKVGDPKRGVPFFGTSALMWSEPIEIYSVANRNGYTKQYLVNEKALLIPRSGQLSGIIGRAIFPYGGVLGAAVSEDAIRINCADEVGAGFLFVALSSEYSIRQLKARAYGSSIPHLDVHQIGRVLVPDPGPEERARLGALGLDVRRLRHEAVGLETAARSLVEDAIEAVG